MSFPTSFSDRIWCRPVVLGLGSLLALSGIVAGTTSHAQSREYLLKDPQKLSAAHITIDSQIRPLRGFLSGFEGSIRFDPEKPELLQGDIEIPLENLRVGSFLVTEVLLSDRCLDTATYPTVRFTIKGVKDVKQYTENSWSFTARAAMVLRGRAGGLEFPATLVYIPDGMTERTDGKIDGDLVVLRGELEFEPAEWGVESSPEIIGSIGEHVQIDFSAIAYTMRSARRTADD